jgi:hypothetical protein
VVNQLARRARWRASSRRGREHAEETGARTGTGAERWLGAGRERTIVTDHRSQKNVYARVREIKDGANRRRKARDRPAGARSSVFVSLQITWVGQQEETRESHKYEDTVLERRVRQQAPICMSACRGWGRDYGGWNWKKRAVRASVREKKKRLVSSGI